MVGEKIPETLDKDGYFWWLRPIWRKMGYPYNKHFAWVVCAESGGGKSYLSMSAAAALYPDFDPAESVAFSPEEFLQIAKKKHKKRFPIILDDAGLSAFSGDALSKQVKAISKVAQSIRYKNWAIILNLPSLSLLAKSVRITNHYISEPYHIDYESGLCYTTFQRLRMSRFNDQLMKYNMNKVVWEDNPNTGYDTDTQERIGNVIVPKPANWICKEYEKMKDEHMQRFREETEEELIYLKDKALGRKKQMSTRELAKIIAESPEDFSQEGKFYFPLIMKKFGVSHMSARNAIKIADA